MRRKPLPPPPAGPQNTDEHNVEPENILQTSTNSNVHKTDQQDDYLPAIDRDAGSVLAVAELPASESEQQQSYPERPISEAEEHQDIEDTLKE